MFSLQGVNRSISQAPVGLPVAAGSALQKPFNKTLSIAGHTP